MKQNNSSILLVGGGTGGHAAPVLAVYRKIKEIDREAKVFVIGVGTKEERAFLGTIPNYIKIKTGKLNRYLTIKNLVELIKFVIGSIQSLYYIWKIKPSVVFSKGGYVSLPVINAARFFNIPYFLHESDIVMGKVNRLLAKNAKKTYVSFPLQFYKEVTSNKKIWSGPILRDGFSDAVSGGRKSFGFKNNNPIIFLTGGSQGSLNMSKSIIGVANKLLDNYNIIHQAGKHSYDLVMDFHNKLEKNKQANYYVTEMLVEKSGKDMMLEAINAADLIITRASSTISELAIKAKPMVVVPWKYSAQDHQLKNAKFLEDHNSAIMITDDSLGSESLFSVIKLLFSDKDKMKEMASNASNLFPSNGVSMICEDIIDEAKE